MNCANHPETPAVAYCQFCGKPLCDQCVHKVGSVVGCDPCLAARIGASSAYPAGQHIHAGGVRFSQTGEGMHAADDQGNTYSQGAGHQNFSAGPIPPGSSPVTWGANPGIALAVGWIPGVGAVYNGQIAKALVHVGVFALLIDLTHYNGLIGLLIPIWVLYQMFDAYQTATARRDGLPLPNPLGLNDVGQWFGAGRGMAGRPGVNPWNPAPTGTTGASGVPPAAGENVPYTPFAAGFAAPPMPPMPPIPPEHYDMWRCGGRGGIPTFAIALIILGVAFLLGNMGILSDYWMERSWPLLLIAIGVWMVVRRSHTPPPPPGGTQ